MIFYILTIFTIVTFNISIFIFCGKQQEESTNLHNKTLKANDKKDVAQVNFTPEKSQEPDLYHNLAAQNLAFPASSRCQNHDDVWRILALYLDMIRSVNPDDFVKHQLLDSGMAVLHDISNFIKLDQTIYNNELVALAIVYFLVKYNNIQVKIGDEKTPWHTIINKRVKVEDLRDIYKQIDKQLVRGSDENNSSKCLKT
ncbi:unnamed protein product [Caenorhabditis angaria]|uniref:Uncharacterized protein n=1 Tax=Caenorhabditis angaria TaxID=860376 RepID=A0A9P1ICA4_9PELO|nr:unnamed protein product [Caenorhabditis angaria]